MNYIKLLSVGLLSLTLLNCGPKEADKDLTKNEVIELKNEGDTTDYCDTFNWYKDGICDTFCQNPDPECAQCEAFPNCGEGYVQVDACPDAINALAIATDCEAVTLCGSTIFCERDPNHCLAIGVTCPPGFTEIAGSCPNDVNDCITVDDGCNRRISCVQSEPGRVCGGHRANPAPCNDNEFCHYQTEDICGAADASGTCEPIPVACTEEYAPVCGCDGQTYSNECSANAAGTSVVSIGECQPQPQQSCGGFAGLQCGRDEFCNYPLEAMCGAADQTGVCETLPLLCTDDFVPVCGCDGQTYSNECGANVAGTSVASLGECVSQPQQICGGFAGLPCGRGDFCSFPIEAMCGATDQTGVCEPTPQACDAVFAPVCGCDGQTYSNLCGAKSAGISIISEGQCPQQCGADNDCTNGQTCVNNQCQSPTICGGNGPNPQGCLANEFCLIATADMCGAADAPGVCTLKPTACTNQYDPVCGCDGLSYGNECAAHEAGISVASAGACP